MQIATLKIEGLPNHWFEEILGIIKEAFGVDASLAPDGTISVSIPDHWSVDTFIKLLKALLGSYDLKYQKRTGPGF